jgi:hypothetical protein
VLSEHGCRIAPRTFYAWVKRPLSSRALWDIVITEILAGYYEPDEQGRKRPESLYGSVKMWAHLNREGIIVAKCTVEWLMRTHGWQGVRRLKRVRTTVSDPQLLIGHLTWSSAGSGHQRRVVCSSPTSPTSGWPVACSPTPRS